MTQADNTNENKKRVLIQLRTTEEDKAVLQANAIAAGMTVTDFIKNRTIGKQPRTRMATPEREMLMGLQHQISMIGNNVNQIAKAMNAEKKAFYSVTVKETLIAQTLTDLSTLANHISNLLEHGHTGERTGERQTTGELPADESGQ
ncbi:hypothetical protein A4D02_30835 [Niastella koreensis]|uniref:Mobilization protein n=2 Tax=Niastella koreensis TaxID=354356 RepID=G8T8Y3_NIAKG|nr:plasmid mobilization relaxosome protein MobC [Niastella koreensis]AEW02340.1 mobilization protein [Niastella koreensis GR20-10]OQP46439.1 hypothetical protein A4D02_30835 [Niastella koreensis]